MKMQYIMGAESVIVNVISQTETDTGETVDSIAATREFAVGDIPAVLKDGEKEKSIQVYGLTKLLQDRTSQVTNPEEKITAMGTYFDEYFSQGLWKAPSEAGQRKAAVDPFFAQAIAEIKGWSLAQATGVIQSLDKDKRNTLRTAEAVDAKIKELRAESADIDVEALVAELTG